MTCKRDRKKKTIHRLRRVFTALSVIIVICLVCTGLADNQTADAEAVGPIEMYMPLPKQEIKIEEEFDKSKVEPLVYYEITVVYKDNETPEQDVVLYAPLYTEQDVTALAQMGWGECYGMASDTEISASFWCVLNRFDSGDPYYANCKSIADIVKQPGAFHGYSSYHPVDDHLVWLARDVLDRWTAEKNGETDVGRTLPREFMYFWGDGTHNHYTTEYQGWVTYDWSLATPYDS